jgi:hypothetical protein
MMLRRWWEWRCPCCGRCQERCRPTFKAVRAQETMPLKAAQSRRSPAAACQCTRKRGRDDIDGEGCSANAKALRRSNDRENDALDTGSLLGRPGGDASGHLVRPRSVRRDPFQTQIRAGFASTRMARSRCVAPLKVVRDAFSAQ